MNKNLKTIFAGVIAASVALSVVGCASTSPEALASIETKITNEIQNDYLVGDELNLEISFTAGQPVGKDLELAVEVSVDDGGSWENLFSDDAAGAELTEGIEIETSYAFNSPGTTQFRATVLDAGVVISEMESESIVVSDLKSLGTSLTKSMSRASRIPAASKAPLPPTSISLAKTASSVPPRAP
jgi:PKD repeat protein